VYGVAICNKPVARVANYYVGRAILFAMVFSFYFSKTLTNVGTSSATPTTNVVKCELKNKHTNDTCHTSSQMSQFCVSFKHGGQLHVHVTCPETRPHDDWIKRCRPRCSAFVYSKHCNKDVLRLTYIPNDGLVHLFIHIEWNNGHSHSTETTTKIRLDEREKIIHVIGAFSESRYEPDTNYVYDTGGLEYLKENIELYRQVLTHHIFGKEWRVVVGDGDDSHVITLETVNIFKCFQDSIHCVDLVNNTIGIYDMSFENRCATQIQAVFRGWQARREFRFDPATTLGRFCVERMFSELL
jgi:hypothetical protein